MNKQIEKLLMAVTTYGEIYETGKYKNNYDIIQQFIIYAICKNNLFIVNEIIIMECLKTHFGFVNLPLAAITQTLKNMECKKFLQKTKSENRNDYNVNFAVLNKEIEINEIDKYDTKIENDLRSIKAALFDYFEREKNKKLTDEEKSMIIEKYNDFIQSSMDLNEKSDEISRFVLYSDSSISDLIQQNINSYIIFQGLNYEISDIKINLKDDIKIYFDMEILFDIMGYNGEYYKKRANEMLYYINEINKKRENTIKMYYLNITKIYIDEYFQMAEKIKYDNYNYDCSINVAMNYILNKSENKFSIKVMQKEFFVSLKNQYKIYEDNIDYFSAENLKYNATTSFYNYDTYISLDDHKNSKALIEEGIKYLDVIIKNRKNVKSNNFFDCKSVFVTETNLFNKMSKLLVEPNGLYYNNYRLSINMSYLTNILWLKLGKGLGNINELSSNNVVMLAKMIIAKNNTKKLNDECKVAHKKMENGEISKETYMEIVADARSHTDSIQPESITKDNCDIKYNDIIKVQSELQYERLQINELKTKLIDFESIKQNNEELKNELNEYKKKKEKDDADRVANEKKKKKHRKIVLAVSSIIFFLVLTIITFKYFNLLFVYFTGICSLLSFIWLLYEIISKK